MATKRFIAKNGLDNSSLTITNVADPTNAQDASTKAYTDGKYSTGGALGTPSSGTVTNLTGTASININGTVGATTPNSGNFSVAQVGVGSGAVSLSINDGAGNANVCFNHFAGIPDNTSVGAGLGSSARITSGVDGSTGTLQFQVGNATSSGVAVGLNTIATMYTTGITSYVDVTATKFISNVATGTAPFTVTSTTPVTNLSIGGNAGTATTATNIAAGVAGSIPYQTAANTTAMTAASTVAGQVLTTVTAGGAPTWVTPSSGSAFTNLSYTGTLTGGTGVLAIGTNQIYKDASGNVGIGTASPAYKLQVVGSFAATTKSFVIDHPTKEGMQLRYGSLEGPENGVYIRGRLNGNNIIELPEYWTKLIDEDSITVNLTPIGKHQKLYVVDIVNNTVIVGNDNLLNKEINCFYTIFAERIDVEKLIVEIE